VRLPHGFGLSDFYLLKTGVPLALMSLGMTIGSARAHPFDRFGPANQITSGRAMVVGLIAGLVGEAVTAATALTAAIAAVVVVGLDGLDGWLARRTRMASDFGQRFDMETDALLILVLAFLAYLHDKAGSWVLAAGLLRYAFVAAGWILPWMRRPLPPSLRRKAICVVQVIGLILALVPTIARPASALVSGLPVLALTSSFLIDSLWLWRQAVRSRARSPLPAPAGTRASWLERQRSVKHPRVNG
jgi:phosphatidylglycerophosphate synthase